MSPALTYTPAPSTRAPQKPLSSPPTTEKPPALSTLSEPSLWSPRLESAIETAILAAFRQTSPQTSSTSSTTKPLSPPAPSTDKPAKPPTEILHNTPTKALLPLPPEPISQSSKPSQP